MHSLWLPEPWSAKGFSKGKDSDCRAFHFHLACTSKRDSTYLTSGIKSRMFNWRYPTYKFTGRQLESALFWIAGLQDLTPELDQRFSRKLLSASPSNKRFTTSAGQFSHLNHFSNCKLHLGSRSSIIQQNFSITPFEASLWNVILAPPNLLLYHLGAYTGQ